MCHFFALQNALKSEDDKVLVQHLIISDRCLAWLSYINLIEFDCLPLKFYDPANSNPSRLMKREPFLIPWKTIEDVKTNPDMLLAVFEGNLTEYLAVRSLNGVQNTKF